MADRKGEITSSSQYRKRFIHLLVESVDGENEVGESEDSGTGDCVQRPFAELEDLVVHPLFDCFLQRFFNVCVAHGRFNT